MSELLFHFNLFTPVFFLFMEKAFVFGYSSAVTPHLWGRSEEVRSRI